MGASDLDMDPYFEVVQAGCAHETTLIMQTGEVDKILPIDYKQLLLAATTG